MNLQKHVNVRYYHEKDIMTHIKSPLFVRHQPLRFDKDNLLYEVVKKKPVIRDSVPVTTAFFILSLGVEI